MTDTAHTPTPWKVGAKDMIGYVSVADDQSRGMVIPFVDVYGTNPEANAAHIVKCVNEAEAKDKRIAELEAALNFYADVSKYPAPLTGGMGDLWTDCGEIARSILTKAGAA